MKTLHLTLKKKFFDMILSGEKIEEYREIKHYWLNRLLYGFSDKAFKFNVSDLKTVPIEDDGRTLLQLIEKDFDTITFKNGYQKNAPEMVVEFKGIDIGEAKPEWSDNWQGDVFRIKLGAILSTTNLKTE